MSNETLSAPTKALEMTTQSNKPTAECTRVFTDMRRKIAEVYPDNNQEAWSWGSEDGEQFSIDPPTDNPGRWIDETYAGSDKFSQRLTQRYFTLWKELEGRGFTANDKQLFEHQKALFAWLTISGVCTGTREETAKTLIRSPYGTGKTLVSGLAMEGFQDLLLELMVEQGKERSQVPTAALIGMRKELLLQNALGGAQYTALRPPYTVEPAHVREFHKQLKLMFGDEIEEFIPKPKGKTDPLFALFSELEGDETEAELNRKIGEYLRAQGGDVLQKFNQWEESDATYDVLRGLMQGKILLPDTQNIPHLRDGPRHEGDLDAKFRGDSAYALNPDIGIRASHKHLLPDPSLYSSKVNEEDPATILLAHGTTISKDPDRMRQDIRTEIMPRLGLIILDEAGKLDPYAVGDSTEKITGRIPTMIGFTGQDKGIGGWEQRSPFMSEEESISLGLTKPIGFQVIGTQEEAFPPGSEGAWQQYRDMMFTDVQTAKKLNIPQPHECDTLVVVPSKQLRELAFRIEEAHKDEGIDAEVYCFDGKAGTDKWKIVEQRMKAPKEQGEPRRVLVSTPTLLTTGASLPIQCIDLLAKLQPYELDQLLGRLYHQRNLGGSDKERTYFRQQIFNGKTNIKLREVATRLGYELPEEDAVWVPLHNAIDLSAKEKDDRRRGMGEPQPVPDAKPPRRQKDDEKKWQSVNEDPQSEFVDSLQQKAAARKREKELAQMSPEQRKEQELSAGKKSYTAYAELSGETIEFTFVPGTNGMVMSSDIEALAVAHDIRSYAGSIRAGVNAAYGEGSRGKKLAEAALNVVVRIRERQLRMSSSSY